MKALQTITLNLKNSEAYFYATEIFGLAFHYSDKHLGYSIKTVEGEFEPADEIYNVVLRLNFENRSELTKLNDALELCVKLDLLAHEFDKESEDTI